MTRSDTVRSYLLGLLTLTVLLPRAVTRNRQLAVFLCLPFGLLPQAVAQMNFTFTPITAGVYPLLRYG